MTRIVWSVSLLLTMLAILLIPFGYNSYVVRVIIKILLAFGWITAIITLVLSFGGTYYL